MEAHVNFERNEPEYEFRPLPFFSTKQEIEEKKGRFKKNRFNYLQALVTEFQDTTDQEAKRQVAANLANFAYDPVNYANLHKLGVPELFLDLLTEEDEQLRNFGISGLCNMCLDNGVVSIIKEVPDAVKSILKCLSAKDEDTVCASIVLCYYMLRTPLRQDFSRPVVVECMRKYKAHAQSVRLKNLASVWLDEYAVVTPAAPAPTTTATTSTSTHTASTHATSTSSHTHTQAHAQTHPAEPTHTASHPESLPSSSSASFSSSFSSPSSSSSFSSLAASSVPSASSSETTQPP